MSITILQKNYKKLEQKIETIEQMVRTFFAGELKEEKIKKLEKLSQQLDAGQGKRFTSYRAFQQYLRSL